MASWRWKSATRGVPLRETLISAGLEPHFADLLDEMPYRLVQVEPRRPFREQGARRNEVMFIRSGILSKFKTDSSGRRQIVALRFPGEGILPRDGAADTGSRQSSAAKSWSDGPKTSTRSSMPILKCSDFSGA